MQVNPSPKLAHLVRHYLILENTSSLEQAYRFFPDGNPGLVFSYADPLTVGRDPFADADTYSALATKIKNAVNAKYLNKQTGSYGSGIQTELSAPLPWGLVPDEFKS